MVLNTELQDYIFDSLIASDKNIAVGDLTSSPTSSTTALTNTRDTKINSEITTAVSGNIIKFGTQLNETEANTYTINTIHLYADLAGTDYNIDISKHTDVAKDNDIIIQYSDQIIFFIE